MIFFVINNFDTFNTCIGWLARWFALRFAKAVILNTSSALLAFIGGVDFLNFVSDMLPLSFMLFLQVGNWLVTAIAVSRSILIQILVGWGITGWSAFQFLLNIFFDDKQLLLFFFNFIFLFLLYIFQTRFLLVTLLFNFSKLFIIFF
jgi:hypothetical protein